MRKGKLVTNDLMTTVTAWFDDFIAENIPPDMIDHPLIAIKLTHSRRVADNCRAIAGELGMTAEEVEACEAMGLLHDIGRFQQYALYRTFSDEDSVNHGELGCEVVRGSGLAGGISPRLRDGLLDGIRCHNLLFVPDDIPSERLPFVKLVRDADKLDIYRIVYDARNDDAFIRKVIESLGVPYEGPVSREAVGDVLRRETVAHRHVHSLLDFRLLQASWIFDINFAPTLRRIRENGTVEWLLSFLPESPETAGAADLILHRLGSAEVE